MSDTHILVTGGAGYIGSHFILQLLEHTEFIPIVVDNLSNSSIKSIERISALTGKNIPFYKIDLIDIVDLRKVFQSHSIQSVIHFAGLKAVGESCSKPLDYYHNNIAGTLNLLSVMNEFKVGEIVFSSSATVYGNPPVIPIPETSPLGATNPYGRTKQFIEEIIRDWCSAFASKAVLLRYFNPIGAHPTGMIGENPNGIPNNLMPYIAQVCVGIRDTVQVFGNDYDTRDGTGIRDYIHVVDLADGHIKALQKLNNVEIGCYTYNLGTGQGKSVMEMIHAMEIAVGKKIAFEIVERRAGDVTNLTADPSLANSELDWKAEKTVEDMCRDLWKWQSNNPRGYE